MSQVEGLWTVTIQRSTKADRGAVLATREEGKTLKEWHHSLGHMGVSSILKLADSGVVDGLVIKGDRNSFKTEQCDTCMISKSTRLPFGDSPVKAETPLGLIHSDVAGPLVMNKDGIQYYATMIDDFTGIELSTLASSKLKTKSRISFSGVCGGSSSSSTTKSGSSGQTAGRNTLARHGTHSCATTGLFTK